MSVSIQTVEFERRNAYLSALDEGPPYTVHGVALGADDVTVGQSGVKKLWPADELEKAAESLQGRDLVVDHNNKASGVIGRVTKAGYKDGTGVIYQAELFDDDLAEKINNGLLEVSIRGKHSDVEQMEETDEGAKIVEDITFDNLSIVPTGAAPSNTIEMGETDELSMAQLSAFTDSLESAELAEIEPGMWVRGDDMYGITVSLPDGGEVEVDLYEKSDDMWRSIGETTMVSTDSLDEWDVDEEDIGAMEDDDEEEEEMASVDDSLRFSSKKDAMEFVEEQEGLTGVHQMGEDWVPGDTHQELVDWRQSQRTEQMGRSNVGTYDVEEETWVQWYPSDTTEAHGFATDVSDDEVTIEKWTQNSDGEWTTNGDTVTKDMEAVEPWGNFPRTQEEFADAIEDGDPRREAANAESLAEDDVTITDSIETGLKNKVEEHNDEHGDEEGKRVTYRMLKSVYRRGAGAYSDSHREGMTRQQWSYARVNAFLYLVRNGNPENDNYTQDNDLLPEEHPQYNETEENAESLQAQLSEDGDELDEVYAKWDDSVNMTATELRKWSGNPCSREASVDPEAVIKRNLELLETNKSDWTDSHIDDANRTISFINRMRGARGDGEQKTSGTHDCPTKWAISLLNWAYNPFDDVPSVPDNDKLDDVEELANPPEFDEGDMVQWEVMPELFGKIVHNPSDEPVIMVEVMERDDGQMKTTHHTISAYPADIVEMQSDDELAEDSVHSVDFSGTTEDKWDKPDMEDFDTDDLSEIDDHFLVSKTGFPPENFGDLALPVVGPDGNLYINALRNAKARASQVSGLSEDKLDEVMGMINTLAEDNFEGVDFEEAAYGERPRTVDDTGEEPGVTDYGPVDIALDMINKYLTVEGTHERDSVDKMLSWTLGSVDIPMDTLGDFRMAARRFLDETPGTDSFDGMTIEQFRDWLLMHGKESKGRRQQHKRDRMPQGEASSVKVLTGDDLRQLADKSEESELDDITTNVNTMTEEIEQKLAELSEPVAVEQDDLEELQAKADRFEEMSDTLSALKERTDVLDDVDREQVEELAEADEPVVVESARMESLEDEAEQVAATYATELAEELGMFSAEELTDKFSIEELREKYEEQIGDPAEELATSESAEPQSGDVDEEELEERADTGSDEEELASESDEAAEMRDELRNKILG